MLPSYRFSGFDWCLDPKFRTRRADVTANLSNIHTSLCSNFDVESFYTASAIQTRKPSSYFVIIVKNNSVQLGILALPMHQNKYAKRPDKLSFYQCCGSVTFWYWSVSSDPYDWLTDSDPDPAFFVSVWQDATKNMFFFQSFCLLLF